MSAEANLFSALTAVCCNADRILARITRAVSGANLSSNMTLRRLLFDRYPGSFPDHTSPGAALIRSRREQKGNAFRSTSDDAWFFMTVPVG